MFTFCYPHNTSEAGKILNGWMIFFVAEVARCDATMEAQNNNQPILDNHNNLYKTPGQGDQVGCLTTMFLGRFKVL